MGTNRLKPLIGPEAESLLADLKRLESEFGGIANIVGPAYGAAMCDRVLTICRSIDMLRLKIEDLSYRARTEWNKLE